MALVATAVLIAVLIQIPSIQGAVAKKALARLENATDASISFSSLEIMPFSGLIVKDLAIVDTSPVQDAPDTLFSARDVNAAFRIRTLFSKNGLFLNRASIKGATMNLVMEPGHRMNLKRMFNMPDSSGKSNFRLLIKKAEVDTVRLRILQTEKDKEFKGMDFYDLQLLCCAKGHNLSLVNKEFSIKVDEASARDKSGYGAHAENGIVKVKSGELQINGTHFKDGWSDLQLYKFRKEFTIKRMIAQRGITDGTDARLSGLLDLRSINAILGTSLPEGIRLDIDELDLGGDMSRMQLTALDFKELDTGISGALTGSVEGVRDKDIKLNIKAENLNFNMKGVESLMKDFGKNLPEMLAREGSYRFSGSANGALDDLKIKGRLKEAQGGEINTALDVKNLTSKTKNLGVSGTLHTEELGVGRILGNKMLGDCTLGCGFSAEMGSDGTVEGVLDSLRIRKFGLMGYDYRDLQAQGRLSGTTFDGRVVCNDPNLNFLFKGLLNFSRQSAGARYNFFAYLAYADLHALGFDSRAVSRAQGARIEANYRRVTRGNLDGTIRLKGLKLESADTKYDMGEVTLNSHSAAGRYSFDLASDFAHAKFRGTQSAVRMVQDLGAITIGRELPAIKEASTASDESYELAVELHDTRDLLSFVTPGLYIADSTFVRLRVSDGGLLDGRIGSPRLAWGRKYIKGLEVNLDNSDGGLNCKLSGRELQISDALRLENNSLLLYASDNNIGLGYYYDNSTLSENRGEIYLTAEFLRDAYDKLAVKAKSLTSNIYANGNQWRILPAEFGYAGEKFTMDGVTVECEGQSVTVDGGISKTQADTLEVNLNNINLQMLNTFVPALPELGGSATGKALILSPTSARTGMTAQFLLKDASVSGYEAGNVDAELGWDSKAGRLNMALRNDVNYLTSFDVSGSYTPKTDGITAHLQLQDFEAGYFSSFVKNIFSTLKGKISGNIDIGGTLSRPDISSGTCSLNSGVLGVAATGVDYYVGGNFYVDNQGVHFDGMEANDGAGGTGKVSGGLLYDRFKNLRLSTVIDAVDVKCVNLDSGEHFYGHLNGTGRVTFEGPFKSLRMEADAITSSRGDLHIPIKSTASSGSGDLLTFREEEKTVHVDPYEQMMSTLESGLKDDSNFSMGLRVTATPVATCNVEIGTGSGNALIGHGHGDLNLEISPSRHEFSIGGDYTLTDGDFHVSAMGLANRDFTITDGSSISFSGDIMDSDLSIDAVYNTKASLSTLIADTTSIATRRNVECGINVSGKLRDPSLRFSINIPDVDPLTKSRVESALSTDDKIQRQFLALLITGSFLPEDASGIVNSTSNMLYSNFAVLMANQLNNILEKLDIPLDLGLGYQTGTSGSSLFDVAVSTQLFNNRVIMNGTIGNRQLANAATTDVVGDIDIEIKLDRSGYLRLTLFSHSADSYTNYLDRLQRNGIGLTYQKEFNSVGEFLRSILAGKDKRAQMELESSYRARESKTIVIE